MQHSRAKSIFLGQWGTAQCWVLGTCCLARSCVFKQGQDLLREARATCLAPYRGLMWSPCSPYYLNAFLVQGATSFCPAMQIHVSLRSGSSSWRAVMVALAAHPLHASMVNNIEKWCFVSCGHGVLGNGGLLPSLRCGALSDHPTQGHILPSWQPLGQAGKAAVSTTVARVLWPGPPAQDNSSALPQGPKNPFLICLPQCGEKISTDFPLVLLW